MIGIDGEHFLKQKVLKGSIYTDPRSILTPWEAILEPQQPHNTTTPQTKSTRPGGMREAIKSAAPRQRVLRRAKYRQSPATFCHILPLFGGFYPPPPPAGPAHDARSTTKPTIKPTAKPC